MCVCAYNARTLYIKHIPDTIFFFFYFYRLLHFIFCFALLFLQAFTFIVQNSKSWHKQKKYHNGIKNEKFMLRIKRRRVKQQ